MYNYEQLHEAGRHIGKDSVNQILYYTTHATLYSLYTTRSNSINYAALADLQLCDNDSSGLCGEIHIILFFVIIYYPACMHLKGLVPNCVWINSIKVFMHVRGSVPMTTQ